MATKAKKSKKQTKSNKSKAKKAHKPKAKKTKANKTKAKKTQKPKAASTKSAAKKSAPAAAKRVAKASKPAKASRNGAKAPPPKDKRQLVQERKILRSQSRWLQKALFALAKAEDDQAKLAEVRGDRHRPMAVTINGTTHEVGAVTDSLRDSVMDRLEGLRVSLRNEHALLG